MHTSTVFTVCVFVVLEDLIEANKSSPSSSLSKMEEKGSLLVLAAAGLVVLVDKIKYMTVSIKIHTNT